MESILNELSIRPIEGDGADARGSELVRSVQAMLDHGMTRILRSTRTALDSLLEKEISLRQWLFSRTGNREEKQFLASLLGKAPYIDDLETDAEGTHCALFEFRLSGERARGLGIAHLHDTPAISFRGDPRFSGSRVEIESLEVQEIEEICKSVIVIHVATYTHVLEHRTWLEQRVQRSVRSGAELWERRQTLFPRLDFCVHVKKQLGMLFGTEPFFPEVIRHLHVLSRTAVDWRDGKFDPPLRWSYESSATMNEKELRLARTFVCPDQVERVFAPHTKLGYGAKRIAFLPESTNRRVWIGHVGDHLPTVRFG